MKKLVLLVLLASFAALGLAQSDDPVLFSIGDDEVHVSEFKYIYEKTNGEDADYSENTLREYLNLYVNFKLKVHRAREMKIDTITSLKTELAGYRKQLADSYLVDKEVTMPLAKEIYQRQEKDVDISHIMVLIDRSEKDTTAAWKKINDIYKKLGKGDKTFGEIAREYSEDPSVKKNGGTLGWMTAPFASGFYEVETAAYTLKPKEYSKPIRSVMGYHIVKLNNRRNARGEIEVAHILIKVNKDSEWFSKKRYADTLQREIKMGANFEEYAKKYSDDKVTAAKGGYVGFFGIGKFDIAFEDGAFRLRKDGEVSRLIKTNAGYHIIKRLSKKEREPFYKVKKSLQANVKKLERYNFAMEKMMNRIKNEANLKENIDNFNKFVATLNDEFKSYKWEKPDFLKDEVLFSLKDGSSYTMADFYDYLKYNTRKRMMKARSMKYDDLAIYMYNNYVTEKLMKFAEGQLEKKYPDFKGLMREYQEGIILFEITKMEVWDKASQDSIGLAEFFKTTMHRYKWDERAEVSVYTLKGEAKDQLESLTNYIKKKNSKKVLSKFNKDGEIVSVKKILVEKGKDVDINNVEWKVKSVTTPFESKHSNTFLIKKIEKILPSTEKTLSEARGFYIADYQVYLEKDWIRGLRQSYETKINEDVFQSLIQ